MRKTHGQTTFMFSKRASSSIIISLHLYFPKTQTNVSLQWVMFLAKVTFFKKCDFSKEQCSSLKMILVSKHVGAILNVLIYKFYVCTLVGALIK